MMLSFRELLAKTPAAMPFARGRSAEKDALEYRGALQQRLIDPPQAIFPHQEIGSHSERHEYRQQQ
jgi:hypothetical protein